MSVKQICAYCGVVIRPGEGIISHGICKTCLKKTKQDAKEATQVVNVILERRRKVPSNTEIQTAEA